MTAKRIRTARTIGGKHGATCGELLALLNEYVDGGVDPSVCQELRSHLARCTPCRVVVDNLRRTITLYRKDAACRLPLAFRRRLHASLRACWEKKGPGRKRVKPAL